MDTILVATSNPGKLREIRSVLEGVVQHVLGPADLQPDLGPAPDVDESGETYADNARLKARAFLAWSGLPSLADDSGIELATFHGWPGVRTARIGANPTERIGRLLESLSEQPGAPRAARFVCVMVLAGAPSGEHQFTGTIEGTLAETPSGEGGFGLDPIFIPRGHDHTMATLTRAEKNRISHRGRALAQLRAWLTRSP